MNQDSEIQLIILHLKETWGGDPWFGRSIISMLNGVGDEEAYYRPQGQHSIADLVWHMTNWRQMVINRLQNSDAESLQQFEDEDWRQVDAKGPFTFAEGWKVLQQSQALLVEVMAEQSDELLNQQVVGRSYDFRTLLHGIVQHDIYHLGQVAYLRKMWAERETSD